MTIDVSKIHKRKCRDCGNVPEVLCKKCGSQDTRVVKDQAKSPTSETRKLPSGVMQTTPTNSGEEWDDAVMYAMETAADSIEDWEYGGAVDKADFQLHRRAAKEVAKRIRRMVKRYNNKRAPNQGTDA